jgi:hypothetical protein
MSFWVILKMMFHVKNNDDDLEKYLQSGSIMLLQIIHCSFFTNIQEMISSYVLHSERGCHTFNPTTKEKVPTFYRGSRENRL